MSDYFVGEVRMFGGNYAPRDWALCNGQLMSIGQNTTLFSLIGTTYGGDGISTFALPDLRGRLPVDQGQGPGLSQRPLGQVSGFESVTVTLNTMPSHSHIINASGDAGSLPGPDGTALPAKPTPPTGTSSLYVVPGANPLVNNAMASTSVGIDGGNVPHSNLMPSLCVSFIIAMAGIFPSRN